MLYVLMIVPLLAAVLEWETSAQRVPSVTALGALEGSLFIFSKVRRIYAVLLVIYMYDSASVRCCH